MNGSNSVSIVILNLDATAVKKSMLARNCSLNNSKGNIFRVAVWSKSWCSTCVYSLSSSPASKGWMFWTRFLFLMELMVDQVSMRIQFGLIIFVVGAYFMVWVMVRPTYSDCVPVRVLAVDVGKFTA